SKYGSELLGVSGYFSYDIAAVGYVNTSTNTVPIALRFNGTKWSVTTLPVPSGAQGGTLNAVNVYSPYGTYAVGSYNLGTTSPSWVVSWNGTKWSTVTSPRSVATVTAAGVTALGAGTGLAVGSGATSTGAPAPFSLL